MAGKSWGGAGNPIGWRDERLGWCGWRGSQLDLLIELRTGLFRVLPPEALLAHCQLRKNRSPEVAQSLVGWAALYRNSHGAMTSVRDAMKWEDKMGVVHAEALRRSGAK